MNTPIPSVVPVPFHGATLFVTDYDGEPCAPMKPIVEGMGLNWAGQHEKLNGSRFKVCVREIQMQLPGDTQRRPMTCLPLRKLPGWLMSIHPNKVRAELRERIIQYQTECDDVLWQHWNAERHEPVGQFDAQPAEPLEFSFESRAIRVLLVNEVPWFVAADVAASLEYRDAFNMTRTLDDDEKGTRLVSTLGGEQQMRVINESGLYSAVLRSRKPEAKTFKRWVTAEVLPAIRRTRRHEVAPAEPSAAAPKQLPMHIPVREVGDLSFFSKSGREGSPYHGPDSFSLWWDYPQHLKDLPRPDGLKVGRGFFAEVAELAEHDEHAAYLVLEAVLGIAWSLPAGNPRPNSSIEYGFAQGMAVAMMTGLRAMRSGAPAYVWGI